MSKMVVCLVGYRNPDDIEECIAALSESTYADFEIVICENGGADAREVLVGRLPSVLSGGQTVTVLRHVGNPGYAGGNNLCIDARPDATLFWILNPDTKVSPDAMAKLAACLRAGKADAVGGTLISGDGTVQAYGGRWNPWLGRAISIGNGSTLDPDKAAAISDIDYIVGASIMFTRHFLETAGPMRDDYFLYCEEIEWGLRAKARGLRLGLEPTAIIAHAQGTTTGIGAFSSKPRLPIYLDYRNKILVLRDTSPNLLIPGAIGTLVALFARVVKKRAWRQFGYGVDGWFAGLLNRRGAPR